jgi:hypothetical protein
MTAARVTSLSRRLCDVCNRWRSLVGSFTRTGWGPRGFDRVCVGCRRAARDAARREQVERRRAVAVEFRERIVRV